jgi:kinesin family protein 5
LGKSLANAGALAPGTVPWGEYYQSRRLMAEATNINVGLLALKRVVDALHLIKKARMEGKQPPHVPYGDSKLTEILSDALGGDGKTTVLVTVASEHEHAIESVQTLRFGERCASVETKAKVGQNALRGMLAALNLSIGELEVRIKLCEKWVTTTTTRRDAHSGMDETVVSSKLGGAESLRTELEGMLAERTFLLGRVAVGTTKKDKGIDAHL